MPSRWKHCMMMGRSEGEICEPHRRWGDRLYTKLRVAAELNVLKTVLKALLVYFQ
jgi:hypothetical protein